MSPKTTKNSNANILKGQNDFYEIAKQSLKEHADLPDIVTFAEHPDFLGRRLYPRQKTLLRLICLETEHMTDYDYEVIDEWTKNFDRNGIAIGVSPDVLDRVKYLKENGYKHFREVVNITGRRGGKGHIGGIIGAYINWGLLMLDDPQWYYGIDKSKDMYMFCHDDQTEILTPNGWVLFKDLNKDSIVGTVNKLGKLEFQKPTDYIDYHYDGDLIIGEKGTQYNFAVTPNHKMLISNYFSKTSGFNGECVCGFKAANYLGLTTHMRHKKNSAERHGKKEIIDSTIDNLFFREASDLIGTERIPTAPWGARDDITSKIKIDVENYANYPTFECLVCKQIKVWGPRGRKPITCKTCQNEEVFCRCGCGNTKKRGVVKKKDLFISGHNSQFNGTDTILGNSVSHKKVIIKDDNYELLPAVNLVDFAKFVGFWIAEGGKTIFAERSQTVTVSQKKENGLIWLKSLLENMGWKYKYNPNNHTFIIHSNGLSNYLNKLGNEANNLKLPEECFGWPVDAQEALLEGLWLGDGSKQHYFSASPKLLEDIQRLLVHLGEFSRITGTYEKGTVVSFNGLQYKRNYDNYKVSRTKDNFTFLNPEYLRSEPYNGKVYCLTVPNGTLITRRNGCTLISSNCVATNIQQAKQFQFADLSNTIIDAPCFQPYIADSKEHFLALRTPADIRRIAAFEARGLRPSRLIASVRNMAVTSNSKASRGAAAFGVMFDEFAHMLAGTGGARTSEEVYNAITPALDQFGKDGFIYIPTSPYAKTGKAYNLYESALEKDDDGNPAYPNMMMCQLPSWGPYEDWDNPRATGGFQFRAAPQEYDDQMKSLERREPDAFRVERLSQWAEVTDAYLNPKMVERMFEPFIDAKGELRELEPQFDGKFSLVYYGHCDPSRSGANTAAMIGHVEKINDPEDNEEWYHVIIDWMKVWNPDSYDEGQIDYEEVEEELVDILCSFRTTKVFSFDQYGAFVTLPRLKKRLSQVNPPHKAKIREEKFSKESNFRRAERFKSALGMNWVHSYRDLYGPDGTSLLEQELKFLQEINGRVDKQKFGPIRTSDLSDCLMVIVDALLEDNFVKLEMRERLGNTNLYPGAQGGYHTTSPNDMQPKSARDRLRVFGAQRSQRDYNGISRGRQ